MKTILDKEFKAYFTSPIGYVFMAFFLLIFGFYFTAINIYNSYGDYTNVLAALSSLLLFAIPLVTMRLLSEEKKNRTDQLLLTSPIHVKDIVLGKYFAAVSLFAITLIITMVQPAILMFFGNIPVGKILTCYLGFFLLGSTLIAISLFISALTENQIISAIASIGLFLFLMLIDGLAVLIPKQRISSLVFLIIIVVLITLFIYFSIKDFYISGIIGLLGICGVVVTYNLNGSLFDGLCTKILQWFSLFSRFENFTYGLLDIGAIVYYLSFIFIFLFLTNQTIEKRRWS
ncbi:ABC transporter permease [Cellulosilyticum lentocellum]|uniref:ABC-2 type transporter n=1 Tax=Cellulosilyticum lentocellum (strain ATCC 49066 / DSM 5427 / NCIMB 11756 / RHM5) TaxID=642492 RepID=F2JR61_CELLD|nr:ABC transporter permease [Cellulosilyticum lentocellum]ADZ85042.1 ABC-2 type transporter [Cellulosilyticum lentocellum DSM 5427]